MKGLYQRGDVWWVRFTPAPGQAQLRFSLDTDDEAKAIPVARALIARESAEARQKAGSCEAEIAAFLAANKRAGLAEGTIETRGYVLRSFAVHVGAASPRLISQSKIQAWHDKVAEKNGHTAFDYLVTVRAWYVWLLESGRVTSNPAAKVKTPELKPRCRREFMRQAQANLLLAKCEDPELKFAIYCGLHAGLRKDEIIEARTNWFDLEHGLIHVQTTPTFIPKNRDNRTIPITKEFGEFLQGFGLGIPFMFRPAERHGKPGAYRTDFKTSYNNLLETCGLSAYTFHDLRRTFASLLVSKGVSIYKVAKWLGDTIEVVEDTYGHLIPQDDDINASWEEKKKPRTSEEVRG